MSSNANGTPSKNANNAAQLPRGVLGRSGAPFPPGARLPSIRGPRDLTLTGGVQKRTFTPNVAASRRTPAKDGDSAPSSGEGKQGGRQGRDGRGGQRGGRGTRGRGGRGRGNLVQLQGGTFADGLANAIKKRGSRYASVSDSTSSAPERPKYVPTTAAEKEEDEEKLKMLLQDDFIEHEEFEGDSLNPVALPLSTIKSETEVETKGEADEQLLSVEDVAKWIKKEEGIHDGVENDHKPRLSGVKKEQGSKNTLASMTTKVVRRIPVSELCADPDLPEVGKLLFFQFPDTLPGLVAAPDSGRPPSTASIIKKEPGTNDSSSVSVKPDPDTKSESAHNGKFKLKDFPEGYVGKLQVMKSGRTKLLLGSVALNIEMGTLVSFHQDAVSVRMLSDGGGDATVLGRVQHKLICLPDVENLLAMCPK